MYNCTATGKHETYFRGDIYRWKVILTVTYVTKGVEFGSYQNLFNQIHSGMALLEVSYFMIITNHYSEPD